jgi:hypothetical protein
MDRVLPPRPYYDSQAAGIHDPSAPIQTGIPQGSPILPILYLFYNADLIEACKTQDTEAVGYIDDVSTLAVGPTAQRNSKTLKKLYQKAKQWASACKKKNVRSIPEVTHSGSRRSFSA